MAEEIQEQVEKKQPYVTIDGVDWTIDELPEEGKAVFLRLHRLTQKEANTVVALENTALDLDEIRASKVFFENKLVSIVNNEGSDLADDIEETDAFPPEDEES